MNQNIKYIVIIILTVIVMACLPKCNSSNNSNSSIEPLKAKIQTEVKAQDSVKKVVIKNDSVRIDYKLKWLKLKAQLKVKPGTVFIPCDSMLKKVVHFCDTIITVDSTEITNLRKVIVLDSVIIRDLFTVVKNDSIEIRSLNKQVKRQKFKTKLVALGLGALIGVSVFRK